VPSARRAARGRNGRRVTSLLLKQLFDREGFKISYTMEDSKRDYMIERFPELPAKDQEKVLQKLPPERRLAGMTEE
jgi:hypothetical protein